MKLVEHNISIAELEQMSKMFDGVVKAVIDIDKGIMVVGGEMHADGEAFLFEHGSKQENVWGITMYPYVIGDDWIQFDSMINFRPSWGNCSRSVENSVTRQAITNIVTGLVQRC